MADNGARQTRMIVPGDAEWPSGLEVMGADQPDRLFIRGDASLAELTEHSVAVVGSRASTAYGEAVAIDLSVDLVRVGYGVASVGGFGIAAAAHRAAVAQGAPTVAVVVAGLDRLHPRANRPLYDKIVREGLLVSLSADGALPNRRDLLASQGLLAALTQATVVVEAAARSGALHVADQARSFGRPVMAIPGPVTSAASSGTNRLIASGQADLVTSAEEVRARLTVGEVPGVETVVLRPGAGPAVGAWERVVAPSRPGSVEPDPHTRQVRHDIPLF